MNQIRLDAITQRIEQAFGAELPFADSALSEQELGTLERVFSANDYQQYLQDQVNRQIILNYLTNAVMLGFITDQRLVMAERQASTEEGRSALALLMLMSSIDEADQLPVAVEEEALTPLRPIRGTPPDLNIIS